MPGSPRIYGAKSRSDRSNRVDFLPDEYMVYSLNVIKVNRIREFAKKHAKASASLGIWLVKVRNANWDNFSDVRATFGNADQVAVGSGKNVIVFNIGGNDFRLICAAHYNRKNLYILRFLTHAEYDKNLWKKEL